MTPHDAVARHDPPARRSPLVLDSPHSGESYPDDFDHAPPRALVRQAEDTHVARLWSRAPAHGATLIEARFPRAYIDANRSLDDVDPELLADAWAEPIAPSRKTQQGIGLVWRLARGGVPMYARRACAPTRCARASTAAGVRITRRSTPRSTSVTATFGAVWHINCHSMPAVGDALSDDPGRERADFVLGDRDGTTCEPQFTRSSRDTLRDAGLQRGDQRSVQGCRDRAQARPAGRAPPQPADRDQAHALHGRGDARAERGLRARLQRDLERLDRERCADSSRTLRDVHAAFSCIA